MPTRAFWLCAALVFFAPGAEAAGKAAKAAPPKTQEPPAFSFKAGPDPTDAASALAHLEALDKAVTGLSAKFRQTVQVGASAVAQSSEGRFDFLKPSRLRLEQKVRTSPEAGEVQSQVAVTDGKTLWVHRIDQNQVIQTTLDDWRKADAALNSVLDIGSYAQMAKRYETSYDSQTRTITMRPKEEGTAVLLKLTLSGPELFPREIELDAGEMKVQTRFEDLRFNPRLPESLFAFKPPPGADVFADFKPPRWGAAAP